MDFNSDEYYMNKALQKAKESLHNKEVPIGCVIVSNNKVICSHSNQVETLNDPTAHAEILAISACCSHFGNKFLTDCTIYITLEPCVMCAGALYFSRPQKVVYALSDEKMGFNSKGVSLHPSTEIVSGICALESKDLLQTFFKGMRE